MAIYKRGSEWHKWDLHVHTPSSALQHSLGENWDSYVERLIATAKAHQVAAIATADYFTIEGYEKLLSYYNQDTHTLAHNGQKAQLYIIPGVELRLNIFNQQEDSINLHLLFDPGCSSDFIAQNFLERLEVTCRGSTVPLKKQNLLAIGKSIALNSTLNLAEDFARETDAVKASYIKKALGAVTLNYGNVEETLRFIDKIFEKQNLPQKPYLVAIAGKGHGGLSSLRWLEVNKKTISRAGLTREHLTHEADVMFSNDPNDRDFYLGKNAQTPPEEIQVRFNNLKPCVWGSDSHSLENLLHPSNGNTRDYTWIKAEVTFEGLRQITYEPELRVRVQQDSPTEVEAYAKIEKLEVDFPNDLTIKDKESTEATSFCIQGRQEISFSSNLTCIIGGRGSGKSSLVHMLYNLVPKRDTDRLTKVNSPLFNLQLNSKDVLGKVRSLTKSDIPPSCEFFLQNEVEKFAKDIGEMSNLIRARLYGLSAIDDEKGGLEQIQGEWLTSSAKIFELISAYDEITRIDNEIAQLQKKKATLKKQTDVISSEEYKALQKDIEQIASAISAFDTYEKEYKRVSLEISTLIKSVSRLDWTKYEGQPILNSLSADLVKRVAELTVSFATAKTKYDGAGFAAQLTDKKTQLKKFLKEKGLSPENIGEVAAATQKIADLEEEIKRLKGERIPHAETYARKSEVLKAYEDLYSSYKDKFKAVIEKLQSGLGNLKFDDQQTSISFQLKTNEQLLKDAITEFIKTNNPSKVPLRSDAIQSVLFGSSDTDLSHIVADQSKIVEIVNNSGVADAHTQILQELVSDPIFLEKLHLRMQQHYFGIVNVQIQTKLGEKVLQNTSFGERCGIVIAIVLVAGTNPIIVDQPEDNLDGKYISTVLVPLIRDQKQRRQIILVTRDANIAIGGDSELILILDRSEGTTALLPATIENKPARSKYIWILDGGEKAFQKREEKYSLKRTK